MIGGWEVGLGLGLGLGLGGWEVGLIREAARGWGFGHPPVLCKGIYKEGVPDHVHH